MLQCLLHCLIGLRDARQVGGQSRPVPGKPNINKLADAAGEGTSLGHAQHCRMQLIAQYSSALMKPYESNLPAHQQATGEVNMARVGLLMPA